MNYSLVTVGNPNSGKTSLFNALTGARQQVGNWSGVTVDKKMGEFSAKGQDYTLMDLPGIYSLANQEASLDEQIASRFVQGQQPDLLLNVIDAANLERSLYLTLQLRELGLPMVVVLNKMDLLQKRRITIDEGLLGQALGCPVVSLSAHNRQQVAAFKEQIHRFIGQPQPALVLDYGQPLEADIAELETLLAPHHLNGRGRALRLLEEDVAMQETLMAGQQAAAGVCRLQQHIDHLGDGRDFVAAQAVQQGFHAVRELGHIREAEGRRTALDGVGAAEDGVELFVVCRSQIHVQQELLHVVEVLSGFFKEDLIKLAEVDACRGATVVCAHLCHEGS